ncbi:MAG: DegT/DnrJ/EryC1/StrS family aminotransferase [Cyclobacteriaceae bacterium]
MYKIPLMRSAFINEFETKQELAEFILNTDRLSMHTKCFEFEQEFSKYIGSKDSILFNSGGSANLAMLQSLKNLGRLKDNDNVGFAAVTWSTNTMPIIQLGMNAIPVDCTVNTLNVMAQNLEESIKTHNLKAFFATNVLGFAGDLPEIKKVCEKHKVIFIEDNCESLGCEIEGIKTGNFGVAASCSFYVAHHMSTIEGGMVCTSDEELAEMLRIVRANGWDRNLSEQQQQKWRADFDIDSFRANYTFFDLGYNLRPTEITGFLGLSQLKYLQENNTKRCDNFLEINELIKVNDDFISLDFQHITKPSPFAFSFICKSKKTRDKYINSFKEQGVELRPMIAGNMQNQPFFHKYKTVDVKLPNSDYLDQCAFYCGNFPDMTSEDLQLIKSVLV